MKALSIILIMVVAQSCLPVSVGDANICDGIPEVKPATVLPGDDAVDGEEATPAVKADKTLMMYRMLHAI